MIKNKGLARFTNPLKFIVVPSLRGHLWNCQKLILRIFLDKQYLCMSSLAIRGQWSHDSYSMA